MLKSMRARMTLRFVLLLIPFMVGTSYTFWMISTRAAEQKMHKSLDAMKDRAVSAMSDKEWETKLSGLAGSAAFKQGQVGIVIRGMDNKVKWYTSVDHAALDDKADFHKWRWAFGNYKQYAVQLIQPRKPIESTLPQTLFGLSVIVIGAAAAGTWFMVGRVLLPIRALAKQSSTASAAHLSVKLEAPSKDAEMRDLVDTLNGLLDRVYETAEIKGRFYAAASHELRTPLQALSGHLELAVSRKRSADEYEAVVKESYIQTRRLISLVQGLLFLHQVDSRSNSPQEPVNLTDSCESALEMMHGQLTSRNLKLEESLQSHVQIQAIPSHAEVLARNLIENAVKYTTEGGSLGVFLKIENENVLLEVVNDFPENVKIATENVFEPFYRDDTSRNSKTGGNGLGLAICRAISTANGWEVHLVQDGGKIKAVVNFGSVNPKVDPKNKKKQQPAAMTRTATA